VTPTRGSMSGRIGRSLWVGRVPLLAMLAGAGVILLALVLLALPGTSSPGSVAFTSPRSASQGAMAGMNMEDLPPPVPKLAANSPCTPTQCPIAKPAGDELAVAGELGATMAAAWITPSDDALRVRLELLNAYLGPVREPITVGGDPPRRACGPGCWTLTLDHAPRALTIVAREDGHRYSVSLPLRWKRGMSGEARSLVNRATLTMAAFIGLRLRETTATGTPGLPGSFEDVSYRLSEPDAMSARAAGYRGRDVTIGTTQWTFVPGLGWERNSYIGTADEGFHTASLFDWNLDAQSVQVLSETVHGGQRTAEVALMNPTVPAWLRMRVDLDTGRVMQVRTVTQGKFTTDRYSSYGVPQRILPPSA
jgi:hypothetical protein